MNERFPPPKERKNPYNVKFTTNDTLNFLAKKLKYIPLDWEQLHKDIASEETHVDNIAGRFAELHLTHFLAKVTRKNPDKVKLDVIPHDFATTNFNFKKKHNGNIEAFRRSNNTITEYDALTLIDNLPVVWEVKIGHKREVRRENLLPTQINTRFAPLQEFFGADTFGYIELVAKLN